MGSSSKPEHGRVNLRKEVVIWRLINRLGHLHGPSTLQIKQKHQIDICDHYYGAPTIACEPYKNLIEKEKSGEWLTTRDKGQHRRDLRDRRPLINFFTWNMKHVTWNMWKKKEKNVKKKKNLIHSAVLKYHQQMAVWHLSLFQLPLNTTEEDRTTLAPGSVKVQHFSPFFPIVSQKRAAKITNWLLVSKLSDVTLPIMDALHYRTIQQLTKNCIVKA